jgi:hypothetical protein
MAGKKLCITWMPAGEGAPTPDDAVAKLDSAGFDVFGARWVDDVHKHAWAELATALSEPGSADVWVVVGRKADLDSPTNRWGLALATSVVRSKRGGSPPHMVLVGLDFTPTPEGLPTALRKHIMINGAGSWAAKVALAVRGQPAKARPEGFYLDAIGHPHIGLWLIVAPAEGEWKGVMFGVAGGAKIQQHGVGARAELPRDTVLEFPIDEVKAEIGGDEFVGCAAKNTIGADGAYYVQVQGRPTKLFVGGYPGDEDAQDAWLVDLG